MFTPLSSKYLPKTLSVTLFAAVLSLSPVLTQAAQEEEDNNGTQEASATPTTVYKANASIREDLFIYLHTGNGKKYRVQGSVKAGTPIEVLTTDDETGFAQIIDPKGRTGWIDKENIATKPGVSARLASLQQRYNTLVESSVSEQNNVDELARQLNEATANAKQNIKKVATLESEKQVIQQKLDKSLAQQTKNVMLQGAGIVVVGILFGLLLPTLIRRRRRSDGWA